MFAIWLDWRLHSEIMANTAAILTSDDESRASGSRSAGRGIVLAGDRTAEFRRARWHSRLVSMLRFSLPVSSLGFAGLYVMAMLQTAGWGSAPVEPTIPATLDKTFAMDSPQYEGYAKDGGRYVIAAKTALPDFKNPTQVKLNGITGEVYDAKKSRTDLTAAHGLFDSKASQLDLTGGITVITQTGMRAELQSATLMTKEGTLVSNEPVKVAMPSGVITSNQLNLNQKTRDVTFVDAVVAHLVPPAKPGADAAAVPRADGPRDLGGFGASNAPVDVTADRLDVRDASKSAQFSGRVQAVQGVARLETGVLDVSYDGADATSGGAAAAEPMGSGGKITRIFAPGPVVLTQGTGDRVTGSSADFDAVRETAVVAGNVVMTSGADKRATAERAEFQQKTDSIVLSGDVVVNSGRNELRGRRLSVDRKSGITALTSAAENGLPKSRIFAKLYQGDGQPGKPVAAAAKAADVAGVAAAAGLGFATFKTDPNAPVDIEADKMVVDDGRKLAVFTGDVKAAQGEFIIRTVEMHALYSGEAGLASVTGAPAAVGAAPKAPAQLTKIEAKGRVIVSSKQNQQVTGDWAIFDTKANTVVIGGKDVILTQDKNIVRGTKLTIDMTTGLSVIVTEGVANAGPSAAPAQGGRASVIFYPPERRKGAVAPPPTVAPKPAASSWESSVEPDRTPN